ARASRTMRLSMKVSACCWMVAALLVLTADARAAGRARCRDGDRGRLLRYEKVASRPTAASVQAYFDEWVALYQDYYLFPPDLPVASREVLADLYVRQTRDLFIFGYSQGSHAALALHRALQDANIAVTGTVTGGVIFDPEKWFLSGFVSQTYTLPVYMSLILLTYDDIYNVYERKTDVFRQPYAATVADLFDMRHFWDDVLAGLPTIGRDLITPSYARKVTT